MEDDSKQRGSHCVVGNADVRTSMHSKSLRARSHGHILMSPSCRMKVVIGSTVSDVDCDCISEITCECHDAP